MAEKTCFKCSRTLDIGEFYRHPAMADGHLGKCKDCARRDVAENRKARAGHYRSYDLMRYYRDHEKRKEAAGRWAKNNPEGAAACRARHQEKSPHKKAASVAAGNAVRDGRLKKGPCSKCGATKRIHGHHEDYSRPLEVVWLCPACHGRRHAEINAERRQQEPF